MFGVSPRRLALYAIAVIALVAANLWRLDQDGGAPAPAPAVTTVSALPDLALARPTGAAPPARDLFRKPGLEPEAPPPAPPPPEPEPVVRQPQYDPMAEQIDFAEAVLDEYRVIGILRVGADMVATLERGGVIVTVKEGGLLPEGFVARRVAIDHIVLAHEALGIERRFQEGVLDGD